MTTIPRRIAVAAATASLFAPRILRAQTRVVRIGFASIGAGNRQFTGGSPIAASHAEGWLERDLADERGLEIRWSFFAGAGPAVNEALANNQLDFAVQGDLPAVIGRANGLRTRLILASGVNNPIYLAVPPDSTIRGPADLRGKTVAWHRGTNLHLAIVKVLAANNLTERDLRVVNLDFAASDAALATRSIDAAFSSPVLFGLQRRGLAKIVYSTKGDNPGFARHSHLLVQEAFDKDHHELTGRIVNSFVRASDWASKEENREELFQIWGKSGHSVENFREDFADLPLAFRNNPLLDAFLRGQYRIQADQALEHRLVRRQVDTAAWFDTTHLDAALRELGLERRWTRRDAEGREIVV
ncbi:sulfonate transport system substrate-binding protein [Humitalea rosea]|uniref:Sulfonate transport system substrate-binding protein n=1 Tax=Humitalea rosea TaxID=990373 RepID=A0A2W7JED4_9PROT|nr:ABC transporter substrate-binding protein [Humitalea rosea]PZW50827.1 sulfonate transport system substrate-binding protein [Humitalea rosea]